MLYVLIILEYDIINYFKWYINYFTIMKIFILVFYDLYEK